jgi:tight adherence protein C
VTVGIALGALVGLGVLGVVRGAYPPPTSLEALVVELDRPVGSTSPEEPARWRSERLGSEVVARLELGRFSGHPRWTSVLSCLEATGESIEQLVTKMVMAGAAGLMVPPVLWALAWSVGQSVPFGVAVAAGVVAAPLCAGAPVMGLLARARERRRHFRCVVGSFVDLVVLSLAGGVGIEGALLAASQVSSDWAAGRMHRVLLRARDSGESPWGALGRLGQELGVPELVELSSTLQLAGTEGTRIRESLSARAVSLRRHEQAEAESAANATTERLFLPGALLLLGFLLFVGYPAVSRILGGG